MIYERIILCCVTFRYLAWGQDCDADESSELGSSESDPEEEKLCLNKGVVLNGRTNRLFQHFLKVFGLLGDHFLKVNIQSIG